MKLIKLILFAVLLISLSGCHTIRSIASGGSEKTYVGENRFGVSKYNTKTTSKSAEVFEAAAKAIKNLPPQQEVRSLPCGGITFDQVKELGLSGQAAAMNCLSAAQANRPMEILGDALASALGSKYQGEAHAIFAEAARAVDSIQSAALGKWNAVGNFGKVTLGIASISKAVRNGQDAQRDQSIAASENSGDTTVGNISLGGGLSNGAQSNDGGLSGSEGELASAGTGGNGQGTSTNTSNGGTTVLNIGDGNNTGIASDSARSFAGTRSTQQNDPSATGMLIDDSNVDQANAIDENNAELHNQPENGKFDL